MCISKESPAFCKKLWLNKSDSPSTGSVVVYHGKSSWFDPKSGLPVEDFFVEISSCREKARIHKSDIDSVEDYVLKITILRDCLTEYLEHLLGILEDK